MSESVKSLRSIKFGDGKLEIVVIEKHQASEDEKETVLKSVEKPRPELEAAFNDLAPDVRKLLGLPKQWAENSMDVRKVVWSFSETTGVRGATICCVTKLTCADAPLVFNTPHLPFEQYSQGGNSPLMPDYLIERLEKLEAEGLAFFNGRRAQTTMFDAAE